MSLSKFKLVNEAEDSYHLSGPDGKTFTVDKNKLSSQAQAIIAKMKKMSAKSTKDDKYPNKFADGGMSSDNSDSQSIDSSTPSINQSSTATRFTGPDYRGNIDLTSLPTVKNPDGSISTVASSSFGDANGKEILIPTVINGQHVPMNDAIKEYYKTGRHLGQFDNINDADLAGTNIHNTEANRILGSNYQNKPMSTKEMSTMPLPPGQSTVAQSNKAISQQRQQEEPGLETPMIAPDELAATAISGGLASAPVRNALSETGEVAANMLRNQVGAIGADVSQLAAKRGAEHFVEPLSNSVGKVMQVAQNLPNKSEVETVFNNAAHQFMDNLPKSEIEAAKNLTQEELSHFFESSPSFKAAARNLNLQTRRAANPNLPNMTQNALRTQPRMMAKGGEIQKYAEGTPNESVQSLMPDLTGQGMQSIAAPIQTNDESSNTPPQIIGRPGSAQPSANLPTSEFSPEEQQMLSSLKPVTSSVPANPISIATQPNIPTAPSDNPYAALDAASAEKIKDYQGLIDAYSKAGTGVPTDVMSKLKNLKTPEQIMSSYKMKDDQFENALKDPNNQMQPFRLLHDANTGNKIMAGIGVLLAGIGSGLTGQPNQAIKVVSDAIDKDIEKQKNDQSNRYNLWKMNRERAHSDLEANVMTRNQLLSMANVYAQQQATRLGTLAAKTNAQLAQTATKQELAQNHIVLAALNDNTGNLGGAVPGTEQAFLNKQNSLINASQYSPLLKQKHAENKANYVPGIGVGTVPVSPTDRTDLTNLQSFKNLVGQAKDIQERNPGGIWTNFEDKAKANQIFGSILTAAPSMLLDIKRYNPDLAETMATGIKSPSSMDWTGKNVAALSQLQDFANSRMKDKSRSLGIKPFATAPQDQIALKWVQDNPNDPKAADVKQRLRQNGVL